MLNQGSVTNHCRLIPPAHALRWLLVSSGCLKRQSTFGSQLRHNKNCMRSTSKCKCSVFPLYLRESHIHRLAKYLLALALLFYPICSPAQASRRPLGIAWRVIGLWRSDNDRTALVNGELIWPGSLLRPVDLAHEHSITLLLPDGQRVLYECFTSQDCERGFRVPALYRKPEPEAVDLLSRVGRVVLSETNSSSSNDSGFPRDEVVAILHTNHRAEISGLVSALSNDTYSYTIRSLSRTLPAAPARMFEKNSPSIELSFPSAGLYEVLITDRLKTPRVNLLVRVVEGPGSAKAISSFHAIKALLKKWNEDYQGWPVHDFQRDYLLSLYLSSRSSRPQSRGQLLEAVQPSNGDTTAEPRFTPKAGVFPKDVEVKLDCPTAGSIMHYTVDGAQPIRESSTYHAPIVVKGTALTIKAFASAKGKKDSPVVTGIFRIEQ